MREFVDWWLQQLSELLPPSLRETTPRRSVAAIIGICDGEATLALRDAGGTKPVASAAADQTGMKALAGRMEATATRRRPVVLQLPDVAVLRKRLSFPAAARGHLEGLLGFELDRETPFARDEIYWTYNAGRERDATGRIQVGLVICPRAAVDPALQLVRSAGLEPDAVEFAGDDDKPVVLPLGAARRGEGTRSLKAVGAVAAALAILAVAMPFVRQRHDIAAADTAIATLTQQAEEAGSLRQSVDRMAAATAYLDKMHGEFGNPLQVLAEATRVLRDDTYLTAIDLRDGKLTLSGRSPSTAHTVEALSSSTLFGEPSFQSPVVQNGSSDIESFTISVNLKSAGAS